MTSPTTGPFSKLSLAAGARLSPISATIAPVTTGGSATSIQRVPATCTIRPMRISDKPTTNTPPSALPVPWLAIAAVTGAIIAKLEPR